MNKAEKLIKWIAPDDESNEGMLTELWVRKLEEVADGLNRMQTTAGGGHSTGFNDEAINHIKEAIKAIQGLER